MTDLRHSLAALLPLCLATASCELFTPGKNALAGAGPRAMEPYLGRASGAVRLSLQQFNGCGVLGDGSVTGPGTTSFAWPYPSTCTDLFGATRPASTRPPLQVMTGVPYFLDQLTVAEVANNLHTDPLDLAAPLTWFKTATSFKGLDWQNASVTADVWEGSTSTLGGFTREVRYGNANWMLAAGDTFLLEVLDAAGNVVASSKALRSSFALENPILGHTQFTYRYGTVGAPQFLGDARINPVPAQPVGSATVRAPTFRTLARLDVTTQGDPFNHTFTLPDDLRGDGVARVTWSQMPDQPFYFPLRFTHPDEPGFPQCWSSTTEGARVPCDFGVDPKATLTTPKNGLFYEPGETFEVVVRVQDGLGNLLHSPDTLPSYDDFLAGQTNGILYSYSGNNGTFGERNAASALAVQGPLQALKPYYGSDAVPWFSPRRLTLPNNAASGNTVSGARAVLGETHWPMEVPVGAEPGTYLAMVKINRQFMGERTMRTNTVYFQVGQAEATRYPQRVGNCDICHMGPSSLRNIAMGMDSEGVEACKSCHGGAGPARLVHQIHMSSDHYPQKKNDCTVCHLTNESVLRASIYVCTACHMQAHAGEFFDQAFTATSSPAPNLQSSCGALCHGMTPPTQHIIPPKRESP